jgi:hypothetical protein
MKKDQRQQSEHLFWKKILISMIVHNVKSKLMLHLFQENKSYGVKTIALMLCLHVAVHHIPNIQFHLGGLCRCAFCDLL